MALFWGRAGVEGCGPVPLNFSTRGRRCDGPMPEDRPLRIVLDGQGANWLGRAPGCHGVSVACHEPVSGEQFLGRELERSL
jgi:hypothetical protein